MHRPSFLTLRDFLKVQTLASGEAVTRFDEIVVIKNWVNELNSRVPLPEGN